MLTVVVSVYIYLAVFQQRGCILHVLVLHTSVLSAHTAILRAERATNRISWQNSNGTLFAQVFQHRLELHIANEITKCAKASQAYCCTKISFLCEEIKKQEQDSSGLSKERSQNECASFRAVREFSQYYVNL